MITTLSLNRFEEQAFRIECREMKSDVSSHIFDSVKKMDPNLEHFVAVYEKDDVITGALHYSYCEEGALINHFHVSDNARDKGVLYELLKEVLMHMQLDCFEKLTINTTYLIANESLLKSVEKFITSRCNIEVVTNIYEDFL